MYMIAPVVRHGQLYAAYVYDGSSCEALLIILAQPLAADRSLYNGASCLKSLFPTQREIALLPKSCVIHQ